MLKYFSATLIAVWSASVLALPRWSGGVGYEARLEREVNPDFVETKGVPQIFARVSWTSWEAQLEFSSEKGASSAGALKVQSQTVGLSGWGRYAFLEQKRWRPFAEWGAGSYFDQITSEFGASTTQSRGKRPFVGVGGGIFAVYWNHLLVETGARISFVRERKEPLAAALIRIGFVF